MVNWENYEEYMLLYADGELKEAEEQALHAFVAAHPELRKELDMYKAIRLLPDSSVVFTNKAALLKNEKPVRVIAVGKWWLYASAAAVLVFSVIIIKKQNTRAAPPNIEVAETQPVPSKQVIIDTTKELHSVPANPVAIENHTAKPLHSIKKHSNAATTDPVKTAVRPKEEYITKKENQKSEVTRPIEQQPEQVSTVKQPVTEEEIAVASVEPENIARKKRSFLTWLPIRREKKEGVAAIAGAVTSKLKKVKDIKDNIKGTDVTIKIGNTELFVVKL